ncbi:kinesin light chain [Phlyctema vagabunda]|uniref:Kinesin light chain n=1 Tax=Phlyctema vagabunda TaxID=108571 RepID=A0ABR4P607_9HELO
MMAEPSNNRAERSYSHNTASGDSRVHNGDTISNHYYSATAGDYKCPSSCFDVPFTRNRLFTGREDILDRVKNSLLEYHSVAIVGIGGIGKSQIAIEYCYVLRHQLPESYIFWIYCGSIERIKQSYEDIARLLKLPGWEDPGSDKLQMVYDWFCHGTKYKWLIVLDNCDDSDLLFEPQSQLDRPLISYLPESDSGRILITSRDQRVADQLTESPDCICVLDPFSATEARSLLTKKLKADPSQEDVINDVVKELDYIPLAITQAAAYIRKMFISVSDYLSKLKEPSLEIEAFQFEQMDRTRDVRGKISNAIFKTWKVSFDKIRSTEKPSIELLSLMSTLERQGIPKVILLQKFNTEHELHKALSPLIGFSFINQRSSDDVYSMHRLVQIFVQKWIRDEGLLKSFQEQAVRVVESSFLPPNHSNNLVYGRKLLPTAHAVLEFNVEDITRIRLLYQLAIYYQISLQPESTKNVGTKLVSLYAQTYGESHPRTISALEDLASTLEISKEHRAACIQYVRILNSYRQCPGTPQHEIINIQTRLALCQCSSGNRGLAIESLKHLYFWYLQNLRVAHPSIREGAVRLANYLAQDGQLLEAEELYYRIHEVYRDLYDPRNHDWCLLFALPYSQFLSRNKKFDEAEAIILEIFGKLDNTDGYEVFNVATGLVKVWKAKGDFTSALELSRHVLLATENEYGQAHFNTLSSFYDLSILLAESRKLQESNDCFEDLISRSENFFGPDNSFVVAFKTGYSACYRRFLQEGVKDNEIPEGFKAAAVKYGHLFESETESNEDRDSEETDGRTSDKESSGQESLDECASEGDLTEKSAPERESLLRRKSF